MQFVSSSVGSSIGFTLVVHDSETKAGDPRYLFVVITAKVPHRQKKVVVLMGGRIICVKLMKFKIRQIEATSCTDID